MSSRRVPSTSLSNPFAHPSEGFCELLFVRHGEQAYRENMPLREAVDPPLSDLGEKQAAAVGDRLSTHEIDAVYASPYQRAHHTGMAIAEPHGHEPVVLDDLREVDLWSKLPQDGGLRDALEVDELRSIFRAVQEERSWDAYPYGEGSESFRTRVRRGIDRIVAEHVGERVVVACHGGVIATVLAMIMESPRDYGVAVHHSSITTVRGADTRRSIVGVNDFAHVLGFQTELNPLNLH